MGTVAMTLAARTISHWAATVPELVEDDLRPRGKVNKAGRRRPPRTGTAARRSGGDLVQEAEVEVLSVPETVPPPWPVSVRPCFHPKRLATGTGRPHPPKEGGPSPRRPASLQGSAARAGSGRYTMTTAVRSHRSTTKRGGWGLCGRASKSDGRPSRRRSRRGPCGEPSRGHSPGPAPTSHGPVDPLRAGRPDHPSGRRICLACQ
jgi:hypothetical protein